MEQQDSCGFVKKEKSLDDTIIDCHLSINIDVMLIKYGKRGWRVCISIRSVREKFIRFYIILFQTKLERKKKKRDGTKSLDHRIEFFVTDSMKQTEDFEIKTLSRDSEAFPKFQSYFSSIHVSRILWSWIASCFELLRFDGRREEEGGRKREEKGTLPSLTRSVLCRNYLLSTFRISYLVSHNFQRVL